MRTIKWNFWKKKKNAPLKANLVYAFTDDDGFKYYKFSEGIGMPLIRLFKIQDFMAWMVRGLTADNIKEIAERMDVLLSEGIRTGRNGAKLGVLISELTDRNERSVPVEIVYNYLACYYVREDEEPNDYNDQVQKEKVIAFKKSAECGTLDGFFFALTEYKRLSELLATTSNSWESIVEESQAQAERMEKLMTITKSENS